MVDGAYAKRHDVPGKPIRRRDLFLLGPVHARRFNLIGCQSSKSVQRSQRTQSSGPRCAVASSSTQSSSTQVIPFRPGTFRHRPAL